MKDLRGSYLNLESSSNKVISLYSRNEILILFQERTFLHFVFKACLFYGIVLYTFYLKTKLSERLFHNASNYVNPGRIAHLILSQTLPYDIKSIPV